MKNNLSKGMITLLILGLIYCITACATPNSSPHVVLVSVDGLRPEIYLEADRLGLKMPTLRKMMTQGTYAEKVRGVFPTLTYPSHTSLVTGVTPARHGIITNRTPDGAHRVHASAIKATTLWQAAHRKGLTTASVAWPVTVGADIDFLIPENPESGAPTLTGALRLGSTPGLFDTLESELGPIKLPAFNAPGAVAKLDTAVTSIAARLLIDEKPNLLLVHLLDADEQQHAHGPDSAQAHRAFEAIDGHIGTLLQAVRQAGIAQSTTIVVVGDHGFAGIHTSISVPALLAQAGSYQGKEFNLSRLTIYATGGAAALYAADPTDKKLAEFISSRIAPYLENHYAAYLRVYTPEDLAGEGGFPGALLALTAAPGYAFTRKATVEGVFSPSTQKGTHGFAPDMPEMATGFIIMGPGVYQNKSLPILHITTVAPVIAHILNLKLDATAPSSVEKEIFRSDGK